jgi:ribulose-5-phosphate 4-epimerase/fuculose-1-phosphate aldolase
MEPTARTRTRDDDHHDHDSDPTMSGATAIPASSSTRAASGRTVPFDADEWAARLQLAACYRIAAYLGWTELIYNHITLRLPARGGQAQPHFLINPFGLHYSEVCASNLVRIDLDGRIIENPDAPSRWPVNPAGFTVHAAIHRGIPDAHCVMHVHTTAGMAVACSESGLSMSNFYSAQLHGKVAYHDFEGITVHADEGPRLVANIGDKPAVILRNHGLLAWGDSVPRTLSVLWLLNRACEIQVASHSMGPVIPIPEAVQIACTRDALQFDPRFGAGQDVFDALTRQVDRIDPGWRE